MCYKLTTAVLTCDDCDWFYVCLGHLQDRAFCTRLNPPAPAPAPVPAVVEKPKAAKKPAKDANKAKKPEDADDSEDKKKTDDVDAANAKKKQDDDDADRPKTIPDTAAPAPSTTKPPEPPYYALDAKLFYMRQAEYRQKQQARISRAVNAKLPSVPRGF